MHDVAALSISIPSCNFVDSRCTASHMEAISKNIQTNTLHSRIICYFWTLNFKSQRNQWQHLNVDNATICSQRLMAFRNIVDISGTPSDCSHSHQRLARRCRLCAQAWFNGLIKLSDLEVALNKKTITLHVTGYIQSDVNHAVELDKLLCWFVAEWSPVDGQLGRHQPYRDWSR